MELLIFTGKIALTVCIGGLIGLQRHRRGKAAGIRTYALVSLGSALFTIISSTQFDGDPSRVAAQTVSGIGFIGAGTIIHCGGVSKASRQQQLSGWPSVSVCRWRQSFQVAS